MNASLIFTGSLSNVKGDLFQGKHYLEPCFKQIKKHIFTPNSDWKIDTYFHMWTNENEKDKKIIRKIRELYNPLKSEFSLGIIKNNFISKMKSNWNAFQLIEKEYDLYIFLRPDIYFNKTIQLSTYNSKEIYHNNGMKKEGGHFGDFYFIMNKENALEYSNIYIENKVIEDEIWSEEKWRKKYIPIIENKLNILGKINNDLISGSKAEVEVYRKRRKGLKGLLTNLRNLLYIYK
tara:strand:+ start:1234 stop:1935 length:702 start_codon:yes stop_codon:yes gene_type:complete